MKHLIDRDEKYQGAKKKALAQLNTGFHLGGKIIPTREELQKDKVFVDTNILIYAQDMECRGKTFSGQFTDKKYMAGRERRRGGK